MLPQDLDYAGVRLRLINSRVVDDADDEHEHGHGHGHGHEHKKKRGRRHGRREGHRHVDSSDIEPVIAHEEPRPSRKGYHQRDTPVFRRNDAATNFELFFDLWFVANLNVFTTVHEIFGAAQLASFIGYIVLLWTTWLMVTIYDVRYTSDSVFERCCRAIHLGVMIGFAEFGTNFDPENQIKVIFQSLSLFLAASRFTLAMQYGLLAWQVRKYTDGKKPLITTAALHFIAAAIYFGISFRYDVGKNSRVYVMWYITGTIETALHLGFSNLSRVLSFIGTHFGERMNLLTLIIVGEGCIILLKNITLLVKDTYIKDISSKWSPTLIGTVISAAALIYIIFQIYFDWLHEGQHGPMFEAHQVWWAVIHLPFHIALVLMLEGVMQFVSYVRIMETVNSSMQQLENASVYLEDAPTSKEVSETLGDIVYNFLEEYPPPEILETYERTNETLEHIAEIDDSFWDDSNYSPDNPVYVEWSKDVADLYSTMVNAVFYAFGIEQPGEEESGATGHEDHVELQTTLAISERYRLTFLYCFACAGIVLMMLIVMHALSKHAGWTPFNIARTAVCVLIAIGLSLTCILSTSPAALSAFLNSPWILPTITISYFVVLVLTHIPHPPRFGLGAHGAAKEYREVEHKGGRELLPTRKEAAAAAAAVAPYERPYDNRSRSRSVSDYADDDDDEEEEVPQEGHYDHHPDARRRSLRAAQRRGERSEPMREKDRSMVPAPLKPDGGKASDHRRHDSGFGAYDERGTNILSPDADRMMSPSPSPPASPPIDPPNGRLDPRRPFQ